MRAIDVYITPLDALADRRLEDYFVRLTRGANRARSGSSGGIDGRPGGA
jgi:hypothetical protein